MMINKRLIKSVSNSNKYIALNVLFQWISLLANILMMGSIAYYIELIFSLKANKKATLTIALLTIFAVVTKFICATLSSRMSYLSSKSVKKTLRKLIYEKLLSLGASYKEKIQTSEVVQVAVEGVDQLETYFGAYLPQFFYSMLAPITLFAVLSGISLSSAIVLLVCVPLIPVTIVAIQRWAKRLLSKYWGQYTALGDTFLENLQGLTTTKIYQSDAFKHEEMNRESEHFRRITMKVLTMQLNSITIMDLIAYGGAALGVILASLEFKNGNISLSGCLMIILLAADFFLPMRLLGSFFHIAMNGMAASDKIFKLLDMEESRRGEESVPADVSIEISELSFSYLPEREILHKIAMSFPMGSFTAIVGESGCGKSTIASILMGRNKGYCGSLTVGGVALSEIDEASLMRSFTYISHQSYLFKGTVRDNLLMARPDASDDELWRVLKQVNLASFLEAESGLDTKLNERASNLSGGQCQRLALARALLHDSPVYIFDEATSNIDVESENEIMDEILKLSEEKTIILISHRLMNVVRADNIYVLEKGKVVESGRHDVLIKSTGTYSKLWGSQQKLENYRKGELA